MNTGPSQGGPVLSERQTSIFEMPPIAHTRIDDPGTSHAAAASVDVRKSQREVLRALSELGEAYDLQIYERLRIKKSLISPSGCRSRRAELVDMGFVEFTGRKGKLPSGRATQIWRVIPGKEL